MGYIELTTEEYRNIILGKRKFEKCLCCDNSGYEYWDEDGVSVLPYPHKDWGDRYSRGPCENCNGIGYVSRD